MRLKRDIAIYIILVIASAFFIFLHSVTHIEFMLHLAAIALEVLIVVFIVERFLEYRENKDKRRQLMYIKSCLFRSEMRGLFISNLNTIKSPSITISQIKNATLDELKRMRENANAVEYKSLEEMEPIIMEYVAARPVWQNFMNMAISYNFEEIFQDMVFILHFIDDVKVFKANNPDRLFVHEAAKNKRLMHKIETVLGDGIRKFLDYAIELKERYPDMFDEILSDYELSTHIRSQ